MNDIGKEYGAALFMVALEQDKCEEYSAALRIIREKFIEYPEYTEFLASPGISLGERLSAIENAFAQDVPEYVVSFMQLLCEKGRIACFDSAVAEYDSLLDAHKHISNARVTSVIELTTDEKQKLTKKLEAMCNGKVNIQYFIDATLIGGLVVEIDGKILDGSVRYRLRDIKEVISI